jgi:DNA-binding MarR family transcriptional regulator
MAKDNQSRGSRGKRPSQLTVTLPQLLVDGSDLEFREFVADFYAAVAGAQSLQRALAKSVGLSSAEFSILLATWDLQKRAAVGVTAVAKHLHVAAAHVTAEVGKLVRAGYIKKTQHPKDTRAVILALTKKGEKTLNDLTPLLRDINDRLFAIDAPDSEIIAKFLKHVAHEIGNSVRTVRNYRDRPLGSSR